MRAGSPWSRCPVDSRSDAVQEADLICLSHLRWNFVYQRPQHLMSRFARRRRVFFVEEPVFDANEPRLGVAHTRSGAVIVVPALPAGLTPEEAAHEQRRLLDDLLERHEVVEFVCWYYTPMALAFTRHLRPLVTLYDCMDELSAFAGAPPDLRRLELELLERADLVFTGGQCLYRAKRLLNAHVYAFPSGVDAHHFQRRRTIADPADQAAIPRPRLGFYGVIVERMDLDLLATLASKRPEWHVVLVGPVVKIDSLALPSAPNLHYLDQRGYDALPAYISGWDVAIIPFALNDATAFISPTKTLEYLAASKPVVSTPISDVVHPYGDEELVLVAADADGFVEAVEVSLSQSPKGARRRADGLLARASWDGTFERMRTLIEAAAEDAVEAPLERRRAPRRDALRYVAGEAG
jgi:UDP-galactopyranose mutase